MARRSEEPAAQPASDDRIEVFEVDCPDGVRRRVTRNVDTGEQTVAPVDE